MRHKGVCQTRNNMLPHIHMDLRNLAAMINFTHNPRTADGENARKVAKRMRKKALNSLIRGPNPLEPFLKVQLRRKKTPGYPFTEINDFPKLTENQILLKIMFSTYQYERIKSYLADFQDLKKSVYYVDADNLKNSVDFTELGNEILENKPKIIVVEVMSRYRGAQKDSLDTKTKQIIRIPRVLNKSIIRYIPNIDGPDSIIGKLLTYN